MWEQEYSQVYEGVTREEIWNIWTDVNSWASWRDDLDSCVMEGPFVAGNHFMLKPKGARAVKIVLTEVIDGYSFSDCTTFPGAKMYDTHTLKETEEGLLIQNRMIVTGPLKKLWIKLVCQSVADSIPQKMDQIVNIARGAHV